MVIFINSQKCNIIKEFGNIFKVDLHTLGVTKSLLYIWNYVYILYTLHFHLFISNFKYLICIGDFF